jgi:sterol desaturase/sphingolipid hydroxylase (fatty acid hydroxylase superfamily)
MILDNEALIRLSTFVAVLAIMLLAELIYPRRELSQSRLLRWSANFGVTLVNTVLMRLLLPAAAVTLALYQEANGAGLYRQIGVPELLSSLLSLVLLDLIIYGQHRLFHAVPWLWRIHRMHHTDLDLDVTSGARFHPIEIFLSMLIKLGVIWLLGVPAIAVILFEVILNASAMFNHSNVAIPVAIDAKLRRAIVNPDMHRVHHSILKNETNSNFGFCLSCWDRWFGTYLDQPAAGHEGMTIGLTEFREQSDIRLDQLLLQPFRPAKEATDDGQPSRRNFSFERDDPPEPPAAD